MYSIYICIYHTIYSIAYSILYYSIPYYNCSRPAAVHLPARPRQRARREAAAVHAQGTHLYSVVCDGCAFSLLDYVR